VCFLALDARDFQTGALPSQRDHYLPNDGERYARGALMPTREFAAVGDLSDRALAARFGVPVEQVAQRRKDLDNV